MDAKREANEWSNHKNGDKTVIREQNAVIESATITSDDGVLTASLRLDYGGAGQVFGGFVLYLPKSYAHHAINSGAGHFVFRCMEVAGVTAWERMAGRTIRVRGDYSNIEAIGHIINDDWFCPRVDFA